MKCQIITLFTIFAVSIADVVAQNKTVPEQVPSIHAVPPGPDSNSTTSPVTTPSPSPFTVPTVTSSIIPPTNGTTIKPPTNGTTIIPPTPPPTTKITTTATTPVPPTNGTSTTSKSTTVTPSSSSTSTKATTKAPATSTIAPTPSPRKFDGPSFVGGIVLASGLVAIGFVAFKFYKARTELNYHTL